MTRAEFAQVIREKYLENETLDTGQKFEVYDALFHTGSKLIEYFSSHERILISVSGGSDSDCIVHLVCAYFPEFIEKCHFVFVNTGLEYDATKRHLAELEQRYGIQIQRIRGKSVVSAVRKYGLPIISKDKSNVIKGYINDRPFAIYRVEKRTGRYAFSENQKALARYIKQTGIRISFQCCEVSKKRPLKKYFRQNNIDLNVSGERKAEGGKEQSTLHAMKSKKVLISICRCFGGRILQKQHTKQLKKSGFQTVTKNTE